MGEDARAGGRGEGHADLQFGIIAAASAVPSIGPSMIEDIFALGMSFDIGGECGGEGACGIFDENGGALPAGVGADAGGIFEGAKEGMAGERVLREIERIPLRGWQGAD